MVFHPLRQYVATLSLVSASLAQDTSGKSFPLRENILAHRALQADGIIYEDKVLFEVLSVCGISGMTTEDFSDASLVEEVSVVSDWPSARVNGGKWQDRVSGSAKSTWTFAEGTYAFGAMFDLISAGSVGTGVTVTIDNELVGEIDQKHNGFWGYVSDELFYEVVLGVGSHSAVQETFTLDDMVFCKAGFGAGNGNEEVIFRDPDPVCVCEQWNYPDCNTTDFPAPEPRAPETCADMAENQCSLHADPEETKYMICIKEKDYYYTECVKNSRLKNLPIGESLYGGDDGKYVVSSCGCCDESTLSDEFEVYDSECPPPTCDLINATVCSTNNETGRQRISMCVDGATICRDPWYTEEGTNITCGACE